MQDGDWDEMWGDSIVGCWQLTNGAKKRAGSMGDGSQDEKCACRVDGRQEHGGQRR